VKVSLEDIRAFRHSSPSHRCDNEVYGSVLILSIAESPTGGSTAYSLP
jgi:hypothetical protein